MGVASRYDAAPIMRRIRLYHSRGMSVSAMAEQTGLSVGGITQYLQGYRRVKGEPVPIRWVNRNAYYAIAAMKFEPPEGDHVGAQMDPTACRRMIQALVAQGFPVEWMSRHLLEDGVDNHLAADMLKAKWVYPATVKRITALYEKYQDVDPRTLGVSLHSYNRSRNMAARREWAPPTAWDPDTIGDPKAHPEWTGACGTEQGYQIHYREKDRRFWSKELGREVWACPPCRVAHQNYVPPGKPVDLRKRLPPGRPKMTHCQRGHDLRIPGNVYVRKDRRGRQCAACRRERSREKGDGNESRPVL